VFLSLRSANLHSDQIPVNEPHFMELLRIALELSLVTVFLENQFVSGDVKYLGDLLPQCFHCLLPLYLHRYVELDMLSTYIRVIQLEIDVIEGFVELLVPIVILYFVFGVSLFNVEDASCDRFVVRRKAVKSRSLINGLDESPIQIVDF